MSQPLHLSAGFALILGLFAAVPARAEGPTCDMCHRESSKPADPEGVDCNCDFFCKEKYYTKPEGMHGNMPCTTCHPAANFGNFPHKGEAPPVNCAMCHPKQAKVIETTVHTSEAMHAVEMGHPLMTEVQSACLACHPPHAGQGYAEPEFVEVNRRSRPCLACHGEDRADAPQVHIYEHPLHVFDSEGPRWGALTTLPLFDEQGRVVPEGQAGALTCNSCHSNHGPDADPEHLRRPGWQKACAACHGADSLALYRYFHKPERRSHIVILPASLPEGAQERHPCMPPEEPKPSPEPVKLPPEAP